MLKKIRKRLAKKRLAAALALALALAAPATPASADIGPQSFTGGNHTVADNIVANGSIGLAVDAGTIVVMSGHSITTTAVPGWGSPGANVMNGGVLILNDVAIQTLWPLSIGLISQIGGSSITMTGGSVTVADASPRGAIVANGNATITVIGGSITAIGAGTSGAYVMGGGVIILTDTAVRAMGAGGWALSANAGGGTINATASGQEISGAGGLIMADGGSNIVNLTATGSSRLSGITRVLNGGTANLTLGGGAVWSMPGDASLTTLAMNGGTVSFTNPAFGGPYKTLTVTGNLSGTGGVFSLNANLGGGLSDLVSVGGTASGGHQVAVRMLGVAPADLYRTVKVIDLVNEAASHTATFSGGGDIGAYRYGVASGSAIPAGYSGVGSLADYYLYNTFAPSATAIAATSTSASASVAWYGEMNDIKKRMGELRLGRPSVDDFWARTYAGKYTVKPGSGQSFNQISRGLEIGKDKPEAIGGGKRYLGWVAGFGHADNTFGAGDSGATDSFYLGAYGSWLRDNGSYLDVVGKHNWFRHSFTATVLGGGSDSAAYKNTGFGLSVETGKRIERGNGVFVEPQLEVAALWSQGKNYITAAGLSVNSPSESSYQVRLGATVGKKTALDGGSSEVYGKLSWIQELAGQSRTTVDNAAFDSSLKGGRLVAGLGYVEDTARHQLYLDFETAWGKTTSKPWGVNLGCRWKL